MDELNAAAAEALEKAADGFESGALRWVQGTVGGATYANGSMSACARGGLRWAMTGSMSAAALLLDTGKSQRISAAERAMGFKSEYEYDPHGHLGKPRHLLPQWNDAPGRTVGDVVDRMKDAAKKLRNGEL
jgi:hypothetical protein